MYYNGCFFTKNPSQALSGKMYKTVEITYFWTKVFYVTASRFVSTSVPLTCMWEFGLVGCILFFDHFSLDGLNTSGVFLKRGYPPHHPSFEYIIRPNFCIETNGDLGKFPFWEPPETTSADCGRGGKLLTPPRRNHVWFFRPTGGSAAYAEQIWSSSDQVITWVIVISQTCQCI